MVGQNVTDCTQAFDRMDCVNLWVRFMQYVDLTEAFDSADLVEADLGLGYMPPKRTWESYRAHG